MQRKAERLLLEMLPRATTVFFDHFTVENQTDAWIERTRIGSSLTLESPLFEANVIRRI